MTNQDKVKEFMKLAGQATPEKIVEPDDKTKILRVKLLMEELLEFADAAGVKVNVGFEVDITDFDFEVVNKSDFVEVADAFADIEYVLHGAAISYGINSQEVFEVVHDSNLKKFGPGGYKNSLGKWIKPPDWEKPDIASVLEKQKA